MKAFRTGHYFLALFFTGFLTGILIVNYIWGEQLSLIGTFTEVYLMRLKNETISFQQYIWYLIRVRGVFFLILFLAMGIRIRKIVAAFFLLWTGMSGGILLSEAVAELGMKGKYSFVWQDYFHSSFFMFRQFLCFCAFVGTIHRISGTDKKRSLYAVCF